MDDKPVKVYRVGKSIGFECEFTPPPPGTRRSQRKHFEPGDVPFAVRRRWRFIAAGAALAAFILGLLAGRFLLP
jgi:hypothetical protein